MRIFLYEWTVLVRVCEVVRLTDTASVELLFNIYTSGIETFVISWDKLLYPCVVVICRLGLEPLCDTLLSVILKKLTLAGQFSTAVS